jgi:hypothetical protein
MNLSLPASLSETEREEQRKVQLFAPLSDTERGWGRGQIRLVELTLMQWLFLKILLDRPASWYVTLNERPVLEKFQEYKKSGEFQLF